MIYVGLVGALSHKLCVILGEQASFKGRERLVSDDFPTELHPLSSRGVTYVTRNFDLRRNTRNLLPLCCRRICDAFGST